MPHKLATIVMQRAEALAACSEEPEQLTRRSYTPALREAHRLVVGWMAAAGMAVREDAVGNLIGRYGAATPGGKTLIIGSHLDSVRDAGRYDGPLGVLVGLAAVESLHRRELRLPFAIDVIAFADEEGVRFGSSFFGSRAIAGTFDSSWLRLADADGMTLAEAMRAFGGDPAALATCAYRRDEVLGYLEVHIEQGPVLEAEGLPVGVVSAIAGATRANLHFRGVAGHAGTVPMQLRRDALCAAAEFILAAEALGRAANDPELVATVGQLSVRPGASNVVPGAASLSLDVRHQHDARREAAVAALREEAEAIAARRGLAFTWETLQATAATACSPRLRGALARAVAGAGYPVRDLCSGAGHDGIAMADLCEVAMLFVRCAGGISHNPAEAVEVADVAAAIAVVERMVEERVHEI
ncbi:MAG: allantoate amidohydrolase [Chloroflexaceae bacterium]|nr:allantoate amidohydrolase [Chloroflexaceae bacterium]